MDLLSGAGKQGVKLNLLTKRADIIDTEFLSKYFEFQEFSPRLTAGKNCITFNCSEFLQPNSEIQIECVDSVGSSLYIESTTKTNTAYREASAYVLSIHVYKEIANGPAKLIIYGTIQGGATVKWVGNLLIDKTQTNTSTVRFYNKPVLEVVSSLSPVSAIVGELNKTIEYTGSFYSYAVTPPKDSLSYNTQNVDIDYRIYTRGLYSGIDPTGSFNNQMVNATIDLYTKTIQKPYEYTNTDTIISSSFQIKRVLNNSTLVLTNVVTHPDGNKNNVVVNVVDGNFKITYPYISYNTSSETAGYLIANTIDVPRFVKQSYATVIYRNLKTFSGFVARHKLYKKSLFSPGEFEVIADEPLVPFELLQDRFTINKSFDKMGQFYNQLHIDKYWYVNGEVLTLKQSSTRLIDAVDIGCPNVDFITLDSVENYLIVKDNTADSGNRTATYYAYNESEFIATQGASYDSNFIELKKDVDYIISLNVILTKDASTLLETDAGLEFYFTSSTLALSLEQNIVASNPGLLKLGSIAAAISTIEKVYSNTSFTFTPTSDLYGTLIIVPRKCIATISNLSTKPVGDYGFSPDILITKLPFSVNVANESFELKAELYDVNSNLIYSNLQTVASFDTDGDSLYQHIIGWKDPNKITFLSGSLEISQSLYVGENAYITGSVLTTGSFGIIGPFNVKGPVIIEYDNANGILESTYINERMLGWDKTTGLVRFTNVNTILPDGTNSINMVLYGQNNDIKTEYRLLPSIPGRNISVLKV